MTVSATDVDVISALAAVAPDSALAALRAQRPEAMRHAQGSYRALFEPASPGGLTLAERFAVAEHVARLHSADEVAAHYASGLASAADTAAPSSRRDALVRHADLLSTRPSDAGPDDLQQLADARLSTRDIVSLSQLIAFVAFQVRVTAGLRVLGGAGSAGSVAPVAPAPARAAAVQPVQQDPPARILRPAPDLRRPSAFTVEQLEWTPWLEPLDLAHADPKQAAALEGSRGNSPYFRLLALDVDVLVERTATDRGIFYTPGGAPRQDRELSAAATSRLNGCIYCTSVHARLAAQLSKRGDAVDRMLQRGVQAGTELDLGDRWQAIVDLAVALAPTPPSLSAQHVGRLRELGLADLEILDVIQAGAFFAWANRLMLTLGEPYFP
jgi:alkylhydroperoxidase domain protein